MHLLKLMKKSIQAKVIFISVIGLFVSLSILGFCNFYNAKGILVSDAEEDLAHRAEAYAREIGQWSDTRKAELAILSTNQNVVNGDTEAALQYLSEEAKRLQCRQDWWKDGGTG